MLNLIYIACARTTGGSRRTYIYKTVRQAGQCLLRMRESETCDGEIYDGGLNRPIKGLSKHSFVRL